MIDSRRLISSATRRVQQRGLLWPIWLGLAGALLAVFGAAGHVGKQQWLQADQLKPGLQATEPSPSSPEGSGPASHATGFTSTLPAAIPTDKLLRDVFRTATSRGVTVASAEPRETVAAAASGLSSATLSLRLVGSYPGIKTVLAELLARYPGLTVQQLRVQRGSGGASSQEASITLQQWLRPATAAQTIPTLGS